MNKSQAYMNTRKPKVVSIHMDANFFYERAVHSLDRQNFTKALKYFRRAAELEQDNPVHHCNIAGVLSELGEFDESNQVLHHIVGQVDPDMTECYFYMANNYANMSQFEEAEAMILEYLEQDPHGAFLEESEDMMEWLSMELDRPVVCEQVKAREGFFDHDKVKVLLEHGEFKEAVRLLETFISQNPEFLAAYNNLALAYYYLGDLDKCKQAIQVVLEEDSGNIHALCNLAVYYLHLNQDAKLQPIRETLLIIHPFHPDQAFKLAMTLAILDEHEAAYRHFRRMLREIEYEESPMYHYAATAAFNTGRFTEARKLWEQASRLEPQADVPQFYLHLLKDGTHKSNQWSMLRLDYHYQLPHEDVLRMITTRSAISHEMKQDPLLRVSLLWMLQHENYEMKQQAIHTLSFMEDDAQAEQALREFLLDEKEDLNLKRLAIMALNMIGATEPVAVESLPLRPHLPEWRSIWQRVTDVAMEVLQHRFDIIQRHDLQTLWIEYLSNVYPHTPSIQKAEGWSAALEYLTAKMHHISVSYADLANRYGVSESTIRKNAKRIDEACHLQEKMQAIFPMYQNKL